MSVPALVMSKPYILITPGGSLNGGSPSGIAIGFGNVTIIYNTCDLFRVADNVMYLSSKATPVNYSGETFMIVSEENIFYKEPIPS